MTRKWVIGAGALAAISSAIGAGLYVNRGDRDGAPRQTIADGAQASLECVESNIRLVEGMNRQCLTPAQYEAMRDRPVIDGNGEPIELKLTSPVSDEAVDTVRNCVDYETHIQAGWFALSGADIRREEYFKRACLSLALLTKARPASRTNFKDGHADRADIESIAAGEIVAFGEPFPTSAVAVDEIGPGVWKMTIGAGETIVYEIAHADFTGDGLGEILAYVSVGSAGGTARTGAVGLIDKPQLGGPCEFKAQ